MGSITAPGENVGVGAKVGVGVAVGEGVGLVVGMGVIGGPGTGVSVEMMMIRGLAAGPRVGPTETAVAEGRSLQLASRSVARSVNARRLEFNCPWALDYDSEHDQYG